MKRNETVSIVGRYSRASWLAHHGVEEDGAELTALLASILHQAVDESPAWVTWPSAQPQADLPTDAEFIVDCRSTLSAAGLHDLAVAPLSRRLVAGRGLARAGNFLESNSGIVESLPVISRSITDEPRSGDRLAALARRGSRAKALLAAGDLATITTAIASDSGGMVGPAIANLASITGGYVRYRGWSARRVLDLDASAVARTTWLGYHPRTGDPQPWINWSTGTAMLDVDAIAHFRPFNDLMDWSARTGPSAALARSAAGTRFDAPVDPRGPDGRCAVLECEHAAIVAWSHGLSVFGEERFRRLVGVAEGSFLFEPALAVFNGRAGHLRDFLCSLPQDLARDVPNLHQLVAESSRRESLVQQPKAD